MMKEEAEIKIWRKNPEGSAQESVQVFRVPFDASWSVLQALEYIYENLDPSLAYRCSCLIGFCHVCIMVINGKPRLACKAPMSKKMEIRPYPRETLIRDLVTDHG